MGNKKRIIIAVVAVVVIIGAAVVYAVIASRNTAAPGANETPTNNDKTAATATITYNGTAFSLSAGTVASGSAVKITNNSSEELDFGSDPHPVHTDNPELNAGDIAPGETKTVTLNEKGEWGFHNHFDPTQRGTITVK